MNQHSGPARQSASDEPQAVERGVTPGSDRRTINVLDARQRPKVEMLIRLIDVYAAQERALNDEENRWVHFVFLYYAGLLTAIGFLLGRTVEPGPVLWWGFLAAAVLAHALFAYTFAHLRTTYYGVRARLLRVMVLLGLDDPGSWPPGLAPNDKRIVLMSEIRGVKAWRRSTKPEFTFGARLMLVLLGHVPVLHLLAWKLAPSGREYNWSVLAIGYAAVAAVTFVVVWRDYRNLDASSRPFRSFVRDRARVGVDVLVARWSRVWPDW